MRMPTPGAALLSRTGIPHFERLITRARHDDVSCRADRTSPHIACMPAQRANQCRVWQVWQRVPACQVWSRNVLLEGLAQVREIFQVHEPAQEDGSKIVICSTEVEQVA